jgi:hypothetical protein
MKVGDTIQIEGVLDGGASPFGAIDQVVTAPAPPH